MRRHCCAITLISPQSRENINLVAANRSLRCTGLYNCWPVSRGFGTSRWLIIAVQALCTPFRLSQCQTAWDNSGKWLLKLKKLATPVFPPQHLDFKPASRFALQAESIGPNMIFCSSNDCPNYSHALICDVSPSLPWLEAWSLHPCIRFMHLTSFCALYTYPSYM